MIFRVVFFFFKKRTAMTLARSQFVTGKLENTVLKAAQH